ncbi:Mediator of RNA polymerase II transcription subunit 20 [Tupaia chinensis]|uniref:Mediator of RNA polymerase II transcription subunit 20 n=2 Tax=Euarchontoglires TaxID=314146 RepID=L9KT19_TUPCH|nr:Mediator of RNA polymerase II transcription subunit 20 [Tupaia chinensis]
MPVAEGKSVQQTVELLTRKLELLGAEKEGTFCVDCETYHTAASTLGSQGQAGKLMYVMHNSEYPLSCFALFESGPCLIADTNFDVLMVKLKGFFQSAKASKIETRGTRYQYCDFLVKVGTVTMGPSARGISVEMPVAEGKSVQQTVELLTRKLELLGAEKEGTFCVDCETYHTAASTLGSQGQARKLMYVMHNSEYPLSCFALFESGPCLIADTNFDVLMVKLKGFFQSAKASKIETRGTRYQYCDFLVKVGTVTMGPSARGISVEVEYGPCVVASDCWSLLLEFLQSFLGSHTPGAPAVFGNRHDGVEYGPCVVASDCWSLLLEFLQSFLGSHTPGAPAVFGNRHDVVYGPADTMVQYMELFNKIRKQQQVPVAGIR